MTEPLTRQHISDTVAPLGWALITGQLHTRVGVASLAEAASTAAALAAAAGPDAEGHLWLELRPDAVLASLSSRAAGWLTPTDLELAERLSSTVRGLGQLPDARTGTRTSQQVEIAIDALDIPAVRPFWMAVLGYVPQPGDDNDSGSLVDPYGVGPSFWFQQMDAPRPQRNRIHLDVLVPHDEAGPRIAATLAAGGRGVYDEAPAFWVLADPEGNEACVCTWQGRDG